MEGMCRKRQEVSANKNEIMQKVAMISDENEFLLYRTLLENVRLFGILYDEYDEGLWREYMLQFGFKMRDFELCYDDLSTGQKRKFQLAFALARKPELLLLDEPTASLDPHVRVEWMELLLTLIGKEKISVILETHLTGELDEVADYILVLKFPLIIEEMLSLINVRFRKNAKRIVPFSVLIFVVELFVEIPKIDGHRKLILAIPSMGKLVWFVVQIVCIIQIFVVGCFVYL